MTTETEFIDRLLLSYAAGALSDAETIMARALLELNAQARRTVARYEAFGGLLIEEQPPADLRDGCLETVLSRIGEEDASRCASPSVIDALNACRPAEEAARDGIAGHPLRAGAAEGELFLFRLAPGARMPRMTGARMILIVEGGYGGRHGAGDILAPSRARDGGADGGGCVFLVLSKRANPLRRLLSLLFAGAPC